MLSGVEFFNVLFLTTLNQISVLKIIQNVNKIALVKNLMEKLINTREKIITELNLASTVPVSGVANLASALHFEQFRNAYLT